jgi:hypothetical protein
VQPFVKRKILNYVKVKCLLFLQLISEIKLSFIVKVKPHSSPSDLSGLSFFSKTVFGETGLRKVLVGILAGTAVIFFTI